MVTYVYSGRDIFWANIVLSLIAQRWECIMLLIIHKQNHAILLILEVAPQCMFDSIQVLILEITIINTTKLLSQ